MMESSRRWSGYVCPDCRFVFRVPRDHDGQGVVCPSCRRMLKIPTPGDRTPPLLAPQRPKPREEPPRNPAAKPDGSRRHSRKSRHPKKFMWESLYGRTGGLRSGDKRQMFWILIGGTCLLVLIVAGVLPALFGGKSPTPPAAVSAPRMPVALPDKPEALPPADTRRADAAFLAAAEPLARKFLEASRIEDMLPVVRNPNVAQARMRRYYPGGKIEPPGMTEINKETDIFRSGTIAIIKVRTRSHEEKPLACAETPQGIKIDWESWVGWSEMSWEDFLASKPTTGQVFRLVLSPVDYYNFAFTSDSKWQAYQLTSPDGAHLLYGYAERGTAMNSQLRPALDIPQAALMLSLKFPENAASNNQVLIEKLVAEGWVLESEDPP